MMPKSKVPQVRFKGFNEIWEEQRLDNIADIVGGGTPSTSVPEYWNGDIDWYSPTEIGYSNYANKSQKKITQLGLEKSSAKILPAKKTILFTSRAGIGDMAILNNNGATNQGFQSLVLKDDYIPYFVYSAGYLIKNYALIHASGSTFLEISGKQLGNMNINVPEKEEQTKIGDYFQQLDKLIEQKEKKYQKLKQFKKAMLDKMFPKNGADTPEIRFKGFSANWEEKSLDELCSIITKQTGFDYSATIKPSLLNSKSNDTYSFIQNKDFEGTSINLQTDFYIPKNVAENFPRILINQPSILITISGKIGNVGLYSLSNKAFIGGAVGICKLINDTNGLVILYSLLSYKGQSYFKSLVKASSHSNITVEDIRKIKVQIPITDDEKIQIGNYFQKLDKQIDLQQKELEKLKNIKKASLDKMFV